MMEDLPYKIECDIEVFETFLYSSVKVLKNLIETIEKSDGYKSLQKNDELESRMNEAINRIDKDVLQIREMVSLSQMEHARLKEIEEKIADVKNEIKKYAKISVVERDIRDIESEFKAKFNKIQESLIRIEKGTAVQVEKICQHLFHLRERVDMINQFETQQLEKDAKLDSMTSDLVQIGNEITWMKELYEELNIKVDEILDDKKNID